MLVFFILILFLVLFGFGLIVFCCLIWWLGRWVGRFSVLLVVIDCWFCFEVWFSVCRFGCVCWTTVCLQFCFGISSGLTVVLVCWV